MSRRALLVGAAALLAVACSDKNKSVAPSTRPSPNASILPAPLASAGELALTSQPNKAEREGIPADSAGRLMVREPEPPPPEAAPPDHPLPEDALSSKDGVGYTLVGVFRWADVPPPAPVPEAVPAAIKESAQKTELAVTVDLASVGRLRFALESPAFPLPAHTELRARTSYYGHVLVWPSGTAYRVLTAGSLRAMFAERRADVAPLMRAKATASGSGNLLGHKTSRTDLETRLGTVSLEQTTLPGSGLGGALLCRLLAELAGAEPTTDACRVDRIPLGAQYRWASGGSLSFVATSFAERKDLPVGYLYVPPAGAAFSPGELPPSASGVFLTQADLAKWRSRAVRGATPGPRAPGEGIVGENHTKILQYLLLDGVPVAWVRPKEQQYVIGPAAGRYTVSWRDFFGAAVSPPAQVELPAFVRIGTPDGDAGARAP
jgi:hypothetical protein